MAGTGQGKLFIGVEISTQQAKILCIDDGLNIVYEDAIKFDTDLPEYQTQGGAHIHEDKLTVTSPTLMWVQATDMLLDRMKAANFEFKHVAAISGTGQQHGSVYWKTGARQLLSTLNPASSLAEQLKSAFSIENSPIWMDSSTTAQCRHLEDVVGGPQKLADITGSRGFERFTGNQIAKIYQTSPEAYKATERISLVSSFACTLFLEDYATIDYSDGSGMNLFNITTKQLDATCLEACAPDLEKRLGTLVPSYQCIGNISQYMVSRYKFNSECKVIAFTGDNPASVAGMRLQRGDVIVSLGTSDTVFLWLDEAKPSLEEHIFVNPVDPNAYMALLCFKNGSLTRERIRDTCSTGAWDMFGDMLGTTPPGNEGNIGFFFDVQEIMPYVVGDHRFDQKDQPVPSFPKAVEVRALIEGQFLAKRLHAENVGYHIGKNTRVLATGGASANKSILQVLADIFQAPVYVQTVANSACLGSAYRAKHGYLGGESVNFSTVVENAPEFICAVEPQKNLENTYNSLLSRYRALEEEIVKLQSCK